MDTWDDLQKVKKTVEAQGRDFWKEINEEDVLPEQRKKPTATATATASSDHKPSSSTSSHKRKESSTNLSSPRKEKSVSAEKPVDKKKKRKTISDHADDD